MTDYTKLLNEFPEINPANYGDDEVNALNAWGIAAHTAIEALQAECAEHKENAMRNARIAVSIRAERDQLQAKLDELQRQDPVAHQFQTEIDKNWHNFIDDEHYHHTVDDGRWPIRALYAAPKALAPLEDYDARHLLSLVPHYFGDTGDMYGMRVLRAMEQFHGIGGTP